MGNTKYTLNSNFCPKPVAELITTKHHFVIPSYQRGYRWEESRLLTYWKTFVGSLNKIKKIVIIYSHSS